MAGYRKVAMVTAKSFESAGAWVNDAGSLGKRQRPDPLAEAGSDSPSDPYHCRHLMDDRGQSKSG